MKSKISIIYKTLILIVSAISLYLSFKVVPFDKNIIYFTMISNVFCFLFYLVCLILHITKKLKKNDTYYLIKGMMTMAITLTMIVYQSVLSTSGTMPMFASHMLECNMVHLVVPLMVILDYIVFGEKGNLKKSFAITWGSILIAYIIFCAIYVSLGGVFADGSIYPYYYMDIEKYGIFRVLINNIVIYIAFILYGRLIVFIDNGLAANKKAK